ncbi:MAG: 4Fe-4S dicluster domain-containing protein [Candidatus Hydrothermarchaeales archaeon]
MTVKEWKSEELGLTIEIDYEKCAGHAECIDVCPTDVYELENGKAVAPKIDECIECCSCVELCPTDAIKHSSC